MQIILYAVVNLLWNEKWHQKKKKKLLHESSIMCNKLRIFFFFQTFVWSRIKQDQQQKTQHEKYNGINLICRKEINIHFLLRLTHIIISFLSLSFQSLLSRPWGKACLKLACNHFNHISKLIKYKQQSSFLLANILK